MLKHLVQYTGILFLLVFFTYCGDNEGDIPGSPPIADPGTYTDFALGTTISLDGSNSEDPDGDPLTFEWKIVSVPDNSSITTDDIGDRNNETAFFTPDAEGEYVVSLTVNDGLHPPVTEEATITVIPPIGDPPVADAGPDQTVDVNETVTLDGSGSSDPDDDDLTYNWAIASRPVGSNASISDKDQVQATIVPDQSGNYEIELTVTDITGKSDKDNVTITAN